MSSRLRGNDSGDGDALRTRAGAAAPRASRAEFQPACPEI